MATITDCHVWAILDDDCEVLAVGQDQVGAWIRYFDGAYYDQPADRIAAIFEAAHGFRCVPCRLVPVEGWATEQPLDKVCVVDERTGIAKDEINHA